MEQRTLSVSGMSCTGCEESVEAAVLGVSGVEAATADHDADTLVVETSGAVDDDALTSAVADAGYEVVS
ncbi:heavy-metal-associated domain-containing protein [Halomicroarcula sp. F13]|uniref:Heavy-metal-associated domain-containing protein n=1 Tax=Haloarcula rubra TaxID=2487747 RepID=A0AAW4PQI8_9EURY|nr:heavy metal-associated domain-containing protein [Halomicroarcula rubra]MBX0322582.1 heavy-metal-associated domain-containing protein [Halomicroarcula rubra]